MEVFILADWMKDRYSRKQAIEQIQIRPTVDSALWKHIIAQKENIQEILECGANNRLIWKRESPSSNLVAIVQNIRPTSHKDPLAEGIWSHVLTKFSIILWRIKWGFLTTSQTPKVGNKYTSNLLAKKKFNQLATSTSTVSTPGKYSYPQLKH